MSKITIDSKSAVTRLMILLPFIGLLMLSPSQVFAYNFTLTEAEFRTWPAYCKVVYVRTDIGKRTSFKSLITQNEWDSGLAVLGSKTLGEGGVHHFCAGTKWLERAKSEADPIQRNRFLSSAVSETQYTLERSIPGSFISIQASTQMAMVLHERDEDSKALEFLDRVISESPSEPKPYLLKAFILHKQKNYELARNVLIQADNFVARESLDIHYNLGLVLVKLGELDAAAEHAYAAYAGGYPLPGLRRQLERLGRWNPPEVELNGEVQD